MDSGYDGFIFDLRHGTKGIEVYRNIVYIWHAQVLIRWELWGRTGVDGSKVGMVAMGEGSPRLVPRYGVLRNGEVALPGAVDLIDRLKRPADLGSRFLW